MIRAKKYDQKIPALILMGGLVLAQISTFALPALGDVDFHPFVLKNVYTKETFSDVKADQWYASVVRSCYELGLMVGKEPGIFAPEGSVTLAEALAFGSRIHSVYYETAADLEAVGQSIENGRWYDGVLAYALKYKIIGKDDFKDLERPATRGELAYMIANLLPKEQMPALRQVAQLPDVNQGTPYYQEIMLLYRAGILSGSDSQGRFKPAAEISRKEIAAILDRVVIPANRSSQGLPTPSTSAVPAVDENLAAYATEILGLVNEARQDAGLAPLSELSDVAGAANLRAKELESRYDHTRPDGRSCFTVLDNLGGNLRRMGENIALGQLTAPEVMADWLNSPGHRQNIMNPNFTGIGIGIHKNGAGDLCWVQLFVG